MPNNQQWSNPLSRSAISRALMVAFRSADNGIPGAMSYSGIEAQDELLTITLPGGGFGTKTNQRTFMWQRVDVDGLQSYAPQCRYGAGPPADQANLQLDFDVVGPGSTASARTNFGEHSAHAPGQIDHPNGDFREAFVFQRIRYGFDSDEQHTRLLLLAATNLNVTVIDDMWFRGVTTGAVAQVWKRGSDTLHYLKPNVGTIDLSTPVVFKNDEPVECFAPEDAQLTTVIGTARAGNLSSPAFSRSANIKQWRFWNKAPDKGTNCYGQRNVFQTGFNSTIEYGGRLDENDKAISGTTKINGPGYLQKAHVWRTLAVELKINEVPDTDTAHAYTWWDGAVFGYGGKYCFRNRTSLGYPKRFQGCEMTRGIGDLFYYFDYHLLEDSRHRVLLMKAEAPNLDASNGNPEFEYIAVPVHSWADDEVKIYYQKYLPGWTHLAVIKGDGSLVGVCARNP